LDFIDIGWDEFEMLAHSMVDLYSELVNLAYTVEETG
jgi:hypothetical protein